MDTGAGRKNRGPGRRRFFQAAAAALGSAPAFRSGAAEARQSIPAPQTLPGWASAPKTILFTDLRYIRAGTCGFRGMPISVPN